VYYFVSDGGAPNVAGPGITYPFYPTLSMGMHKLETIRNSILRSTQMLEKPSLLAVRS